MAGWYIRRGERIVGPVELPKLKQLAADGRVLPTDQLAKETSGPWTEAARTTLFAEPKSRASAEPQKEPPSPTSLVPTAESLPAVTENSKSGRNFTQLGLAFFAGIGRGMLATWGVISRSMATRSQRKHELKLAKIQSKAIADSQRPPAPQTPAAPPATTSPQQPAILAPQVAQTTVVQVVNKN